MQIYIMDIFKKQQQALNGGLNADNNLTIPREAMMIGANLEALRDIKEKIEDIYFKISEIERKLEEKIPEKPLSEQTFKKEIVDSEEVVNRIISEIRYITRPLIASKQHLSIVEQKKIEKIASALQDHGKLSSSQLAQILNLSRTRCNEYFKQMEDLGLVEGIEIGKEKYYRLKS